MKKEELSLLPVLQSIKSEYNLSNLALKDIMQCSAATVSQYLNGATEISIDKIVLLDAWLKAEKNKDIYEYVFNLNTSLSFFHGSRQGIKGKIVPEYSKRKKPSDFGKGFYLGETFKQSSTFVAAENKGLDRIYRFAFDMDNLKTIRLDGVRWVMFVAYNRGKINEEDSDNDIVIKDMKRIINNKYDVIIGPIADDRMSISMDNFFANLITYEQLMDCLKQLSIGDQYCLLTQKACDKLEMLEEYYLTGPVRYFIREYATEKRNDAVNESTRINNETDETGRKFKDLLKEYGKYIV